MDPSKKEQLGEPKKKERSRMASIFGREQTPVDPKEPVETEPTPSSPVLPPLAANAEALGSFPRISRIGNCEILWREDALGYAWPTLKHLAPTCTAGLLIVRVKQARALANPSSFGGKQTPYCKLEIGKTVRKTPKLKNAGPAPVWESTQQFSLSGTETELMCTVLSKRGMSRDPIGRCIIQLEYLLQLANPGSAIKSAAEVDPMDVVDAETVFHESWFEVRSLNGLKYAGEVLLRVQFFPDLAKFADVALTMSPEKSKGSKKKKLVNENVILEDIRKGHATKGKVKIFGGSLKTAVALSKHPVPRVVKDCVAYLRANGLDELGLFRIPGNYVAVELLKKGFDDGIDVSFENAHDCGAVLKLYLRELKEPLVPFAHYEHFLAVQKKYGSEQAVNSTEDYRILMSSLPQVNRDLLGFLCAFLEEVAEHEHSNRMNVKNVAIVFAPNVLRPQVETAGSMAADMTCTIEVMETLIRHHNEIFPPKQYTRTTRAGTLSRDRRGISISESDDLTVHADDDSKRPFTRGSAVSCSGLRPLVIVDSYACSSSRREESVTSTLTHDSQEAEEDYETENEEVSRRASTGRMNEVEELRRELELLRANNEALKDTVVQLNLQIEDIKAGAQPIDASPRIRHDSVAHNYYAMREARVGALKVFASQPVAVPKVRSPMDMANGGKGSSGQLLASVGRTVSISPSARARGNSTMREMDQYEVVSHLRVRDAPSTAANELGVLEVGQKVSCMDIRGNWLRHEYGWSMVQTEPSKEGPRKQFLVLHNPISRRTDRSTSLAGVVDGVGAPPLSPANGVLRERPSLVTPLHISSSDHDRVELLTSRRADSPSRKGDDDERASRVKEEKSPRREEPLDLKAFVKGSSEPTTARGGFDVD